jgi:hypothetical protein
VTVTGGSNMRMSLAVLIATRPGPASTSMPPPVARSITNPDRQAQTLATVAEALAARGETRQARYVASVACAVGRWTMALVPVLSLEPSAVRVLTGP